MKRAAAPGRAAAERRGRRAESLAAAWLACKGYRIAARRFRSPAGEIDLVAVRGRVLAGVEVKARADGHSAAQALGPTQRARIARALEHFVAANQRYAGYDLRLDAVLVVRGRWPRHIPDAWRVEDR